MTKKILAVAMAALLMLSAMSMSVFATDAVVAETTAAETEPVEEVKDEVLDYIDAAAAADAEAAMAPVGEGVFYVAYNEGNNDYDGLSAEAPKKSLGSADGNGSTGLLAAADGGTLVSCGRMLVGSDYTYPAMSNTMLLTGNDGTTDFKTDVENPYGAMKFNKKFTLTFQSDIIIDDIVLYNELDGACPIIAITNNSTMVIGENVVNMSKTTDTILPCNFALYVEEGSTLIVKAGTFEEITGGGNVYVADGVVLEDKVQEVVTDENGMIISGIEITRPVLETEAPVETTAVETTEAPVDNADGGVNPVVIVAVVLAVVVVVAVVAVVAKKKK